MDQKHLKGNRLPCLFKNIVKPNLTASPSRKFQIKALGFTRSLVNAVFLEKVVFFLIFTFLGASVQPNLQCHETVFLKLTLMVRFPNRTISVNLVKFNPPRPDDFQVL